MIDTAQPSATALDAMRDAAGPGGWTDDASMIAPHLEDWRGRLYGASCLMLRPADTAAVARIVRAAAQHRVALVPQGGNTGLVGGGIPSADGSAVLIDLTRMNQIRAVDADGLTMTLEAGVILSVAHAAAAAAGCVLPLSLAAKDSATIGGLISTNAGGVQVLRHGTMRALVLGLEAVLPDGSVLDQLGGLVKDNSGYDVKQLLIGAEGTLGIVTAATVRLVPQPAEVTVALAGVADPHAALAVLARLRRGTANAVESFELMPRVGIDLAMRHVPGNRDPLAETHPWYVLIEAHVTAAQLTELLAEAAGAGEIADAAISASEAQAAALWRLRETLPEAERIDGSALKHDISVPVSRMPGFMLDTAAIIEERWPEARVLAFGHLGDGNIHFNVRMPVIGGDEWVARNGAAITRFVNDRVMASGGSISAEHGIGTIKRAELQRLGDPGKLAAMRVIKAALDPHGIMNPGKVV
ncbi:FAD-binding oxidoreductase [Glacieibacterium sp.]|uniref:FAD-binding oxidoreductase n=1 Tax=Glacieibacterium sp. TaxID=2860237 RepID=UPI003B0050C1